MENGEASSDVLTDENAADPPQTQEEHADDPRDSPDLKNDPSGAKTPRKRQLKKALSADHTSSEEEKTVPHTSDRPARERKSIERFSDSIEKEKVKVKEFRIQQGKGTCLKDIPNVAFKLSKRKRNDEYVHLLHKLIYGKRAKPNVVKANVLEFSGCVWGINEEKEKAKMKERLEKCVKENLLQLTDILDLPLPKATSKKEEVVLQLLRFFDSPHKATDKLLGEEQKEKGRRKSATKGPKRASSGGRPSKKHKVDERVHLNEEDEDESDQEEELEEEPEEPKSKNRRTSKKSATSTAKTAVQVKTRRKGSKLEETDEELEDPESTGHEKDADSSEEPDAHDEEEAEEQNEEEAEERIEEKAEEHNKEAEEEQHEQQTDVPEKSLDKKRVPKSTSKASNGKPVKTKSVYDPDQDLEDEKEVEGTKSKSLNKVSKKQESEDLGVTSSKARKRSTTRKKEEKVERVAKTKKGAPKKAEEETESSSIPSDDDLRAGICELLRDADFSTVTFTDVVKQLGVKFNVDLTPHKAHVKLLIQEEISKLVDEEDEGEDEEAEEPEQEQVLKG